MLFLLAAVVKEMTDVELITQYKKKGDTTAMGELFRRYSYLVFGVAMKYLKDQEEAKDAMMMVFEKLMDDLMKHEVRNFKSWLHSVTRNHCLMKLRSERSQEAKAEEYKKNEAEVVEFVPEVHLNGESPRERQLQQLEAGIKTLKEEQRRCVELFFLKGKCYQEVADITGYTMKQVKSYLQNGKRNLKLYMLRNQ